MIRSSACQPWHADQPGPCRRARGHASATPRCGTRSCRFQGRPRDNRSVARRPAWGRAQRTGHPGTERHRTPRPYGRRLRPQPSSGYGGAAGRKSPARNRLASLDACLDHQRAPTSARDGGGGESVTTGVRVNQVGRRLKMPHNALVVSPSEILRLLDSAYLAGVRTSGTSK
jgi:hypothetical protein